MKRATGVVGRFRLDRDHPHLRTQRSRDDRDTARKASPAHRDQQPLELRHLREQRIVTLTMPIMDQPGVLARVSQIVGEQGGNILDVFHRRLSLNVPVKSATLELSFEARDAPHAQAIVAAIRAAGFEPSVLTP